MKNRKDIRLKKYNYKSNGYYFVTTVSKHRQNIFKGSESKVENQLKDTINNLDGITLDYFVIMPNHIHIIFIFDNSKLHLGEIVRRFKSKISRAFAVNVWQANYYEHVIRTDQALEKIREYIINNPQTEIIKFEQFYKARSR